MVVMVLLGYILVQSSIVKCYVMTRCWDRLSSHVPGVMLKEALCMVLCSRFLPGCCGKVLTLW